MEQALDILSQNSNKKINEDQVGKLFEYLLITAKCKSPLHPSTLKAIEKLGFTNSLFRFSFHFSRDYVERRIMTVNLPILEYCLKNGYRKDNGLYRRWTPLFKAVRSNSLEAVKIATLYNNKYKWYASPIIQAITNNSLEILKFLIEECDFNPYACDDRTNTLLEIKEKYVNQEIRDYIISKTK